MNVLYLIPILVLLIAILYLIYVERTQLFLWNEKWFISDFFIFNHTFSKKINIDVSSLQTSLSASRVSGAKFFKLGNKVLFRYNKKIGAKPFPFYPLGGDKAIYQNVSKVINGYIEIQENVILVKAKYRWSIIALFSTPLTLPLFLYPAFQDLPDVFYRLLCVVSVAGATVPSIIFYTRGKRYFKLFCQALET